MGRRWTREDDDFLVANAGALSVSEMASELGRNKKAVSNRASLLRDSGRLSRALRVYDFRTEVCPVCYNRRERFEGEKCAVCRRLEVLERTKMECGELWAMMPDDSKARCVAMMGCNGNTPSTIMRQRTPRPKPPAEARTDYRLSKALDDYAIECEHLELEDIERELRAWKMRKQRWGRKIIGNFPAAGQRPN